MRKIQEVLRLAHEQGLGIRAISRCINASPSTMGDYSRRAKVAGLTWPLPTSLDEATLEGLLFKPYKSKGSQRHLPDWASLLDLNFAIRKLLTQLNDRPFKKLPGSRRQLFESLGKPALKPLPRSAYAYAEWKKVRVNIDYHVELKGHYYSVPYQLVKRELDMRYTANTVECFHKGKRVASHPRSHLQSKHTTLSEHMPEAHRRYGNWSPQRIIRWAQNFGPDTAKLITHILTSRRYPQQGFRSCLGKDRHPDPSEETRSGGRYREPIASAH
uniref:Transposase n=1 Tax=Candidatus Kentrum sp. FW TaxID=2126338 RepID=A0A450THQ9_9GAMM|nr:MAG: Transposase [Candidatus Kentron sp. FW]